MEIGFIGLGAMGSAMAANLVKGGPQGSGRGTAQAKAAKD